MNTVEQIWNKIFQQLICLWQQQMFALIVKEMETHTLR
jgi:hypothetical protein